jgi:hypothetical protein
MQKGWTVMGLILIDSSVLIYAYDICEQPRQERAFSGLISPDFLMMIGSQFDHLAINPSIRRLKLPLPAGSGAPGVR